MRKFTQFTIALTLAVVGAVVGSMSVAVAQPGAASGAAASYQGLWWNAPPLSESGWGINFAHQGDAIFATWFTYDTDGYAWWLSMTANKTAEGTYSGTLLRTTGPAFDAIPFDPTKVTRTPVGSGTLSFSDANSGQFSYTVEGVQQTKTLTRQVFGPQPECSWSAQPNLAGATNYQDLWWVANGAESGWGVNLTHQGDNIFATWFTYGFDGSVLWLSATAAKGGEGLYTGTLYRTTGPPFNAQPFDPNRVTRTPVGRLTITFADGNTAVFAYTVNGITQMKRITRQVFYPPAGTVCSGPQSVPTSVTVASPAPSPWVGETVQLTATVRDQFGYVIEGATPTWSSSNSGVATISANGALQGLATGPVVMTASVGSVSGAVSLTVAPMPRISVAVGTAKEVVFRWATDRCEDLDTPDLPTHVVRAEDGSLVLFAGNAPRFYVSRGADFRSFRRDCGRSVLESADRRTPESYENWEWIAAVYREGSNWHAIVHNEFHDTFAATCQPGDPSPANPCWYNSVTYAISTSGAYTFSKPTAPGHVIAPPPNVWVAPKGGDSPNWAGRQFLEGFQGLHSLVRKDDGFVYGILSVTPDISDDWYHPCLIRTDSLGDPASWRAWDGRGFNLGMTSPYVTGNPPLICAQLSIPGFLVTFNTYLDRFLYLGNFSGTMGGKPACGFYYSLSPDLFHWSPLQLVAPMRDDSVCPFDLQQPGLLEPVPVLYPTVIDHADTTINFERPGRTPYLYYVRYNRGTANDPLYWLDRDLVRVPLTFTRQD